MKTKEQVIRYTSLRQYSEEDWKQIVLYVTSHYDVNKMKKARRAKAESTFQEFLAWEKDGLGECDVIVASDGAICMCHDTGCKYVIMAKYHHYMLTVDTSAFPDTWERASEEQESSIMQALRNELYACSQRLGTIYCIPDPPIGQMIKIKGTDMCCIVKEVENHVARLWALLDGDELMLNRIMHRADIIAEPISNTDRKRFDSALQTSSLYWDGTSKKLISHIFRVDSGDYYWYIDDRFGVTESKDRRTKADNERYKNRNYFADYQEALRFRKKIYELTKDRD